MTLLFILGYIIHILICRYIYFKMVEIDTCVHPNPVGVLMWFIPILGVSILLILYVVIWVEEHPITMPKFISHFFTPPSRRK